ncbi:type II toxin-antitoxin system VapC family toxin [Patulibacter americanus]|uniref:type II toxin-antitoxin system VapC family toxin n=1 Tax=Patulibacter americanus TaxID=588672 RepID=UPI0003B3964E|nr:type II toxin-antitoxin system VapC family toxin [Patulibacter americanus]
MNVVDAGVVVELLVGSLDGDALGAEDLAAPHLIDSEVTNVLRALARRGALDDVAAAAALDGFAALDMDRFGAEALRPRMWDLRHNLSAYDATYVALAEAADATALLTTDRRLAAATGIRCAVRVL